MAIIQNILLGSIVPGNAISGQNYPVGAITLPGAITITGLQAVINGDPPTGSNLRFCLRVDGVNYDLEPLIILAGARKQTVLFSNPYELYAGSEISLHCLAVGAGSPGSWIELRLNIDVETVEE